MESNKIVKDLEIKDAINLNTLISKIKVLNLYIADQKSLKILHWVNNNNIQKIIYYYEQAVKGAEQE